MFNAQGGLITSGVTDAKGHLLFQTNVVQGIILREHVLYYIQELKAPAGYELDDTKHWFCFCNERTESCAICDQIMAGVDAVRIPFEQIGKISAANKLISYDLPATGGIGVYPLMLASVMFIVTPLVYIFIRRRKRGRRGVG
jgi:LPXTG-motif cell wall-anchored protein